MKVLSDNPGYSLYKIFEYQKNLYRLTKPTITLLVVITAIPNLLFSSSEPLRLVVALCTLFGTALVASSSAVFNQILEVDIDHSMNRTRNRSIPSGKVKKQHAVLYALILMAVGLFLLYVFTTPLAMWIALAGHLFYVLIYTLLLKRRTPQNIVIGGIAGAVGPLISSAAVCGRIDLLSFILFMIITLWTPPHFWALALKYQKDYAQVGIPMHPVVYGDQATRRSILIYSLLLIPCVVLLPYCAHLSFFFLSISGLLTVIFVLKAWKLFASRNNQNAMPLFFFSCLYTFALFGALTFDYLFQRWLNV